MDKLIMNFKPSFPPRVFTMAKTIKSAMARYVSILDFLSLLRAIIVTSPTQGKQELNHGGQAFIRLPAF